MDANAIQICVRVRPWHPDKEQPYVIQPTQPLFLGEGTFAVSPRKPAGGSLREVVEVMDHRQIDFDKPEPGSETKRGQPGAKRYKNIRYIFDHVFRMDSNQETIFERAARPLLPGVLEGYNATIFAYGATGCGKTHTISGSPEDPGITIRIMRELFEMIESTKDDYDTYIELSMVEIYNELIRDLLSDEFPNGPIGGLKLLENEKERVTLDKVTLRRPRSVEEVMELVLLGNQRRSSAFTESNSQSSRSHAVLQINVGRNSKGSHEVDLKEAVVRQCTSSATLSIIDLAGSERAAATRNMGARMKEGANINKSLLALSSCISALCQAPTRGMKPHIPYRNSKLTRMLKFSLGGNCRTVMIVCVSPSSKDIEDTHNTLVWANRAKNVSTKISRNTAGQHVSVQQYLITIDQQQQRIRLLEANIAKLEAGSDARPAGWALRKLEVARAEAKTALDGVTAELQGAIPVITEGATQRALWDTAEMRIAALRNEIKEIESNPDGRSAEEVARDKDFLSSLITRQDAAYRLNQQVQSSVYQEAKKTSALDRLFCGAEERTFGDAFEARELQGFKRGVAVNRSELAKVVASARERGYREAAQVQAESFAQAAALIYRFAQTVQEETDLLSGLAPTQNTEELETAIERLRSLRASTDSTLAEIFGRTSLASPAPLPLLPTVTSLPLSAIPPSPLGRSTSRSTPKKLGPPARQVQPIPGAPFSANPAVRRLLNTSLPPGSPVRAARVASPIKSAVRKGLGYKVGAVKGRTPKKAFRWKDEAGEGHIDDKSTAMDALVFSSSSEVGTDGTADEWADEESEQDSPRSSSLTSTQPAQLTSISGPAVRITKPRSSLALPMPDWKQNRIIMGKTAGGLSTLGEETESGSSPDSKPTNMGPPTRLPRAPLSERLHVPAASSPTYSSSSVTRPTAASAAKMADLSKDFGKMGAPSRRLSSAGRATTASKVHRWTSTAAPYSTGGTAQRRIRASMMPGQSTVSTSMMDTSLSLVDGLPSNSNTSINMSALGGPRRLVTPTPMNYSPKSGDANRRSSVLPPSTGPVRAGPRASVSMASLPRVPLASRPSISNLRGFGPSTSAGSVGLAGAGDSSTRAAWR